MKTFLATCFLHAETSAGKKSTMARVFVTAASQDDALVNIKSQSEKEGYIFKKLEMISVLENSVGLGVKEGIQKASKTLAYIEPFEIGYFP